MKISDKGLTLIRKYEGCRLTAYKCPAGVWTIGAGHTGSVDGKAICSGMKITSAKATELLAADCAKFEARVAKYTGYGWNQNEFDALVSFAFNVGSIAQLTANGKRSRAEIAAAMLRYNKAGGKVLAGLTKRRTEERELFLAPCEEVCEVELKVLKKGSKGEPVKGLQRLLVGCGYGLAVDGDFGAKTENALKDYQDENGLTVDGVAGAKTYEALLGA